MDHIPRLALVGPGNLHDRIARGLGEAIVAGQPPPGASLPTETELCATLGVSRSALREGFRLLAGKGLIMSRRKVGTVVRPRTEWNFLDPDVLAWHLAAVPSDSFVAHLFEIRRIIEPAAAAIAAQRADSAATARIAAAYAEMARAQDGGDVVAADLRFHEAVLGATANPFLGCLGGLIASSLRASFSLSWGDPGHRPAVALRLHRAVVEAVENHQPEEAFDRMAELLASAIEDVLRTLARPRDTAPAPTQA